MTKKMHDAGSEFAIWENKAAKLVHKNYIWVDIISNWQYLNYKHATINPVTRHQIKNKLPHFRDKFNNQLGIATI